MNAAKAARREFQSFQIFDFLIMQMFTTYPKNHRVVLSLLQMLVCASVALLFCMCTAFAQDRPRIDNADNNNPQQATVQKGDKEALVEKLKQISAMMEKSSNAMQSMDFSENVHSNREQIVEQLNVLLPDNLNPDSDKGEQTEQGQESKSTDQGSAISDSDKSEPSADRDKSPIDTNLIRWSMGAKWGNLPEKFRQQLISTGMPEFLNGYEKQIETYYRRLAEMSEDD
jgi:hypothetical protein